MDLLTKVNEKIEENKAEMISSLSKLLSIPSVAGSSEGGAPFGKAVQEAYEYVLDVSKDAGFKVFNADNYGGHVEFRARALKDEEDKRHEEIVGIVGHLDVVPEGEGWDFDPYGGEVIDGRLCGRGAVDDKGPLMAAFYAMKALKDCGYEPSRTIRMIIGLDEETNWEGMDYYLESVSQLPCCGFTPDADFPAIHGEKGILVFDIAKVFAKGSDDGLILSSLKGGSVVNAVAENARAVIRDTKGAGYDTIKEMVASFREEKNCRINCKGVGKSFEITVKGVAAHGSLPEEGLNAISLMMEFLGRINFANEDVNDFIGFYNDCIGFDIHGERLGCSIKDEPSGSLILNVGKIALDKKSVELAVNIRYPLTSSDEKVYAGMMKVLDRYGLGIVKESNQLPVYMAKDDPMIVNLMDVYRKHTGDNKSQPLVIGGGTYARAMDNIVAFGPHFPGTPQLEHQANESILIDELIAITKIYAEAIYKLCEMK